MKKCITYLLPAWLMIGCSFLSLIVFAQETPEETSTYVKGITAGRARALVGVAAALVSLVIGWRVKVRANRSKPNVRSGAIAALVLGSVAVVLSVVHLSISAGAVFGSGSGKAGAIFALVPALIGIILGGLVLRKHPSK